MPNQTVSRRSGFVPGNATRRFVSSFVPINWLNGQRFSTFHFIKNNGFCTKGRMSELLLKREGKEMRRKREEESRCERQLWWERKEGILCRDWFSTIDPLHERSILLWTFFFPFVLTRPRITVLLNSAFSTDQENGGINGILKRAWMFVSLVFV